MGGGPGSTKRHGSGVRTFGAAQRHFPLVSRETRDFGCCGSAARKEQGKQCALSGVYWGWGHWIKHTGMASRVDRAMPLSGGGEPKRPETDSYVPAKTALGSNDCASPHSM